MESQPKSVSDNSNKVFLALLLIVVVAVTGFALFLYDRATQSSEDAQIDLLLDKNDQEIADSTGNDDFSDFDTEDLGSKSAEEDLDEAVGDIDVLLDELDSVSEDFGDFNYSEVGSE